MSSSTIQPIDAFDFLEHLVRQKQFSLQTFGPGRRQDGVRDHLLKEIGEVRAEPDDVEEWADVTLLALDGAYRAGISFVDITTQLQGWLRVMLVGSPVLGPSCGDGLLLAPLVGGHGGEPDALRMRVTDLLMAEEEMRLAGVPRLIDADSPYDLVAHLDAVQRLLDLLTDEVLPETPQILDHLESLVAEGTPLSPWYWPAIAHCAWVGALRQGHSPQRIVGAIAYKQQRNENRSWPDWRTVDTGKAITHIAQEAEGA